MKKLALMSLLFVSTLLAAQEPVKIKLWQNGAPNDNGMTSQVEKVRSMLQNRPSKSIPLKKATDLPS